MKTETIIKLLVSSVLTIIIDQTLSLNQILREALEPFLVGPFLEPIKSLIILCFIIAEIAAVYGLLEKLTIFERIFK